MGGIYWQLSFVEPKPPNGSGFLGGVVTEADTLADAITWTHLQGINPGGAIAAVGFRADHVDPAYMDRLLDRNEQLNMPAPENPELIPDPPVGEKPVW